MRLINTKPIYSLKTLSLSQNQFGLSRNFCSHGEHLKALEQRLIFLKRCYRNDVIPPFINNSIRIINRSILFPIHCPYYVDKHLLHMKKASLRQNIRKTYLDLAHYKSQIITTRNQLKESLSTSQFDRLILIFEENNAGIKSSEKKRLISKFSWITRSISAPTNREREYVALDPIEEPPSYRVTTLEVDLTDNEKKVLSLGPNFAITPRVDENLVKEVKLNMASCAYQLRWMKYSENTNTSATRAQHLKKEGAPINKTYVHPPPTNNTIVEDKLKQMNNFVIHLYKNSGISLFFQNFL